MNNIPLFTMTTINEILTITFTKNSIYDEILNNVLKNKVHLKPELISELSISFLNNPEKIEKVFQDGWWKYYFIRSVTNQVNSSTSPFYKMTVLLDNPSVDNISTIQTEDIEDKLIKETQHQQIEDAMNNINVTWFDAQIFAEYYIEGKSHRAIEREFEVDHCLSWTSVNKTRNKIKEYIKNNNKK